MPATKTTHASGTFCWPELATSDYAAAKRFYSTLFGWDVQENDTGGGEMYGTWMLKGAEVGACYRMRPEESSRGTPPHWNSYVAVASAERAAATARELGGTVVMEPFDVMDVGRMAVIQDPTGAMFCVWQANQHAGAGVLNRPGALCWTELMTTDPARARSFYTRLFGWTPEDHPMGPGTYTVYTRGTDAAGGMMKITPEMGPLPPCWVVYLGVEDCDASAAKAVQLGGRIEVPPTTVPMAGRFAVIVDPQGAHFGILQPPAGP
jgi:predicted enzyme related to lactoylglutathione lyase